MWFWRGAGSETRVGVGLGSMRGVVSGVGARDKGSSRVGVLVFGGSSFPVSFFTPSRGKLVL